jgi:hypothetical protein
MTNLLLQPKLTIENPNEVREEGRKGENNAPLSAHSQFMVLYFSCFKFELMSLKQCHHFLLAASIEFPLLAAFPNSELKELLKVVGKSNQEGKKPPQGEERGNQETRSEP